MFSFLNVPFPCEYGHRGKITTAFLVGVFVALFLFLLKPFNMVDTIDGKLEILEFAGFGVVTFLGMLFTDFVIPKLFPRFFEESNYTLGKELIMGAVIVLVIGLGNSLYVVYFFGETLGGFRIPQMIWQTFLVGIFPLTLTTLLNYNKLLKSNLKASSEILLTSSTEQAELSIHESNPSHTITIEQDKKPIDLANLAYIESVGNYVNVALTKEGELSRNLYRSTLKSIEESSHPSNIMRCHRSYLVNLAQVTAVSGNAQGLKLTLKNCDLEVPVSRKYIPIVKKYFAQTPLASK